MCSHLKDDVLVYTRIFEDLLIQLEEVFHRLRKFNVKINPQEMDSCSKDITWCGRNVSSEGIKFNSEMTESLMSPPERFSEICVWEKLDKF